MKPRKSGFGAEIAALCVLIVLVLAALTFYMRHKNQRVLNKWRQEALETLATLSVSNDVIRRELAQIDESKTNLNSRWTHDHVVAMTNGECLIYAYRHASGVDHLFLARGSDGKWYSSSFHFCNRMAMIVGDDPAGSILEFARRYSLHEFTTGTGITGDVPASHQ